jgi:hypothetical protein
LEDVYGFENMAWKLRKFLLARLMKAVNQALKELQTSHKYKKRGEEMQNVTYEVKDDKLIIEIDLTKEFGPSKSGKTITVASSRGNQKIEGTDVVIGLNVYKYPENE